ncbi:hypothetical protein [Luteithermobacter gelatinilyticus]|uniref:hypothetical protein n=1 Tax=Luteithermobacter gelatinilyticus TaxID=2582913 RepID=UPI00143CC604|nr:hypothetical protein [Luteithermobacter gelatinilyticus]
MARAILAVRPGQTPQELGQTGPALRVSGLGPLTLSDAWPDAPHRPAPSSA